MRTERVVVIGAGMAGLVAALELARTGLNVTVVERSAQPGGKLRQAVIEGRRIDVGPTVFTMRWVFDEIFAAAGTSVEDHLALQAVDVLARHAWRAGGTLDLFADVNRSAEAIAAFAGAAEGRRFRTFCRDAKRVFDTLDRPFMRAANPGLVGLVRGVGAKNIDDLWAIRPFTTLWKALGGYFYDVRLRQLFARYATYCGSSPFAAPATLMLVAHVEQEGVWLVEGGMHRIAEALASLAAARGATFRYGAEATRIHLAGGRVASVELASRERLPADAVVVNADAAAIAAGYFGDAVARAVPPTAPALRSLSAVTWAMVAETRGFPLLRHTVFFSDDYAREFEDIFHHQRLPRRPTVYVCAQDRADQAPPEPIGAERLFCLVNAPATGDKGKIDRREIERCESEVFQLFRHCGLTVARQTERTVLTTPREFARLFSATGGALYGMATHGWKASFRRPGPRSRIPGLYLAGGSAHPGPGVPMAALSGRQAAASLLQDLVSIKRSRPVAMRGGTSTA
jgi:1-hydroxycarotenoid 3,4-desaturase